MRMTLVLSTLGFVFAATFLAAGSAAAKGPFRAEISGPGMASPVTIDEPLEAATVFTYDGGAVPAPDELEPAYTVKLMSTELDGQTGEYPVLMTLTYFPGDGEDPGKLRGDWDGGNRYFEVGPEFESVLENAIRSTAVEENDDRANPVWYIAPSLTLGAVLIGGLAGRRLLMRRMSD